MLKYRHALQELDFLQKRLSQYIRPFSQENKFYERPTFYSFHPRADVGWLVLNAHVVTYFDCVVIVHNRLLLDSIIDTNVGIFFYSVFMTHAFLRLHLLRII